jgi:hypothetical protein
MAKGDMTTISVSKAIRDKLKDVGKKSETYDDIILRLLKTAEENRVEKQ